MTSRRRLFSLAAGAAALMAAPFGRRVAGAAALSEPTIPFWCPKGFLPIDGRAICRKTYAQLFAVIGTTFGAGDGVTTFNLPDLGRVLPGLSPVMCVSHYEEIRHFPVGTVLQWPVDWVNPHV